MFVKIRFGNGKELYEFPSKRDAFNWVSENYSPPQVISVLFYEYNVLEAMERYFYVEDRFIRENIVD